MSNLNTIISWFPGIIFPLSLLFTIYKIIHDKSVDGINPFTYFIFFIAGCIGFLFSKNILKLNNIFGFLVPTILNIIIIFIYYFHKNKTFMYYSLLFASVIYSLVYYLYKYNLNLIKKYNHVLGMVVNLLLPFATFLQLLKIYKNKSSKGISIITWSLQILGNIGLYFLEAHYDDPFTFIGSFGTSIICALIIYFSHLYKH